MTRDKLMRAYQYTMGVEVLILNFIYFWRRRWKLEKTAKIRVNHIHMGLGHVPMQGAPAYTVKV